MARGCFQDTHCAVMVSLALLELEDLAPLPWYEQNILQYG